MDEYFPIYFLVIVMLCHILIIHFYCSLLLGYAYPGFECYKTVEKNRVDIEELRFWCKYWYIIYNLIYLFFAIKFF